MEKKRTKGYYIYYTTKMGLTGVDKKVDHQMLVFLQHFDMSKVVIEREKSNLVRSIIWRLPFFSFGRDYNAGLEEITNPDFIYIRMVPADRRFLHFIKTLRSRFPSCKIVLEVATYPYKNELLNDFTMFPFYFKDIYNRLKLKKYIDKVVNFDNYDSIFEIPAIKIMNGLMVDNFIPVQNDQEHETINLIAVAVLQKSHGYERCIKGLYNYYQKNKNNTNPKIKIHIVGDGPELRTYKALVKKYKLEEYIVFHGRVQGKELDRIYETADIALGIFGLYKIGIDLSSALKIKEYLAKGLPFISGCQEDIFQDYKPYFTLFFPNDANAVDMDKVVGLYRKIYHAGKPRQQIHKEIHEFAKEMIDMPKVMKPVVDYLKECNC